ncbi:PLP-dependent aminotransferase family protein [Mycoplasmatota bacterium WC30]
MITLFFDLKSKTPLYEQLYNHVKLAIENNELQANEKLPSKRKLAAHLKVSVITIETAYNQLMAEGYIKSIPKSGFYVLPYIRINPVKKPKKKSLIKQQNVEETYEIDFRTNQIDNENFPYAKFSRIERDVLLYSYSETINKTDYLGLYSLRERIAELLYEYRGIETSPESIVVGSGSEYLISLLVLLLGRDNTFGVEEPGYLKNYRLYLDYGAKAETIGLDEDGIDLKQLTNANIIHVTPSHQFPKGIVTPIARRIELLNWAYEKSDRYIIEDDYDSEFRFSGNPIPAMKGMDSLDKVIYMNSFSKSISTSLRVSFMVLPDKLMNRYHESYSYFTCSVPVITQMVLEKFIEDKEYERHLNRMKNIYKSKRDLLIEYLKASNFGDKIEIIGEEAGLHFLVKIDTEVKLVKIIQAAKNHSVRVYGINEYCLNKSQNQFKKIMILGYSHLKKTDFIKAVNKLEKAWEKIL